MVITQHILYLIRLIDVYLTQIAFIFSAGFEQVTVLSEDVVEIHSIGVLKKKKKDNTDST